MKTVKDIIISNLQNRVSPINFMAATAGVSSDCYAEMKTLQIEGIVKVSTMSSNIKYLNKLKMYSLTYMGRMHNNPG